MSARNRPAASIAVPMPHSGEPEKRPSQNAKTGKETAAHACCVLVNGENIRTDAEGYIVNLDEWSEDFATALAEKEGLALTGEHWQVIRYLRAYYEEHRVQAQVRYMIKHFAAEWGKEKGNNHYLHLMFPRGGPQKQGNRLAGLLKTKGEH